MVLLHIVCENRKQAHSIVDELISEKLVLDAMISDKLLFKRLESGERKSEERTLVMGSTKALLFKKINDTIRTKHGSKMPLIYAMPIVYMDEQQTKELLEKTQKV